MTKEFLDAFHKPRPKVAAFEFRLYHKDTIITDRIAQPSDYDWPEGDYLVVPQDVFQLININNRIIEGKLVKPIYNRGKLALVKADNGEYTSLKDNIMFPSDRPDADHYTDKVWGEDIFFEPKKI